MSDHRPNPDLAAAVNPFLASSSSRRWWDEEDRYALSDDALAYVELENDATRVRTFKIDLVDGLMQTPEYAAEVIRADLPRAPEALVRRQVDARTRRQERLRDANPIRVETIITEGALRIQVGGPTLMRRQLDHLVELAELPNVDVRVVPATGAYPAMGTPFYLLSFGSGYPDIGYVDLPDRGVYLEEPDDVATYAIRFADLRAVALDPATSRELIVAIGRGRS